MNTDDEPAGTEEYAGPLGYTFAVADQPFCCWEYDHGKRTLEFLDGLNPDYFATMAMLLGGQLESDDALAMSVTLRMLYAQAIEALLALLGATAQAPEAVPAPASSRSSSPWTYSWLEARCISPIARRCSSSVTTTHRQFC